MGLLSVYYILFSCVTFFADILFRSLGTYKLFSCSLFVTYCPYYAKRKKYHLKSMTLKSMMDRECFLLKLYLRGKLVFKFSMKVRVVRSWNWTFSSLRSQHNSVPLFSALKQELKQGKVIKKWVVKEHQTDN